MKKLKISSVQISESVTFETHGTASMGTLLNTAKQMMTK